MSAAPLIECSGLGKSFGSQRVLDGIDLRLVQGEFLGLVGPNGAGKSTLLRLLLGLCRRTTGTCAVFGIDPERDPKAVRARCSYLPGETSVYREMTGDQFLAFATSFHARADDVRARRLADLFRLPLAARVRSYSAGMKQKLAILAALAVDADLYLLDEPDRALDASMRIELHAVLRDMRRNGATFLLSSHHLEELEELCTRFEFLRAGRWVPSSEISRKGSALLHRARVQLIRVDQPPTGVRILRDYGDGRYWIDCGIDPLTWLRSVPPGVVMSAQLGQSRLRDLYEALYFEHPLRAQGEP